MPTLNEIVAEYMAALQAGQAPPREKILADNSQLVKALQAFFDELDRLKLLESVHNRSATQLTQRFDAEPLRFGDELSPENRERIRHYLNQPQEPLPSTLENSGQADATASQRIGPYKLLQQLGVGGMGQVWMAEQERPIRRRVAIKLIKAGMDTKQVVARFEAERQALALMDHQNIAKVLDAGTTSDQQPYFVMELVQGIPLNKYCDQNRLSIRERLNLFVQVCNAVQHAHQKGIVHRDLKPSNILVTLYDGHPVPKVIDFGLAKALQHQVKLTDRTLFTEFGQVVGTLQYMSPEQTEMNALDVDTRTDIYSLGVVLYELLTGSTPIDAHAVADQALFKVLEKIREADPPPPSRRLSESGEAIQGISLQRKIEAIALGKMLRGDLDWIVMKALDKDRSRRYGTADNFAEDIERFLAGDLVEARPPSLDYRLGKFVRKHRSLVISTVAVVSLLLAATLISVLFAIRADEARREAVNERSQADRQRQAAELAAERATKAESLAEAEAARAAQAQAETTATLARSNFHLAQYRWREGRCLEANRLLHSVPPQHRKVEWHVSRRIFEGSDVTLYGPEEAFSKIAFNSDGSRLFSLGLGPEVEEWDPVQGLQVGSQSTPTIGYMTCTALNTEKQLAVMGLHDGTVQLWNFQSKQPAVTLGNHDSATLNVEISPDGTRAASAALDGVVKVWDLTNRRLLSSLAIEVQELVGLLFHPTGNYLLTAAHDGKVRLWDTNSWQMVLMLSTGESLDCMCVSPGGKQIATANQDFQIKLWDLVTQQELASLSHSERIECLAFSPDGSRLAAGSDDATVKLFDVTRKRELFTYRGHVSPIESLAFSPDGSRLASADSYAAKLWDTKTGKQDVALNTNDMMWRGIELSPDGSRLAASTFDNIEISDTKSLSLLRTIEHEHDPWGSEMLRFSSDNTQLTSATSDGQVRRWSLSSGEDVGTLTLPYAPTAIDISPSGKRIATGTSDGEIKVWTFPEGQNVLVIPATANDTNAAPLPIEALAMSEDKILSVGKNAGPKIWDLESGSLQQQLLHPQPYGFEQFRLELAIAFSHDHSRVIAQNTLGETTVWDTHSGLPINRFSHEQLAMKSAVIPLESPTRLATLSDDRLYWWDLNSREELLAFPIAASPVYSGPNDWSKPIAVGPQGDLLATVRTAPDATEDTLLQLWHTKHSPEPLQLFGHRSSPTEFAFSSAGALYSKAETADGGERFRWDLSTLTPSPVDSFPPDLSFKPKAQHGTLLAYGHDKCIMVLDTNQIHVAEVQAYRRAKAAFSPTWHWQLADEAYANNDWYSGALHSMWALSADSKDVASHYLLRKNLEAWELEKQNSLNSSETKLSLCTDVAENASVKSLLNRPPTISVDDMAPKIESRLRNAMERSIEMAIKNPKVVHLTEVDRTYARMLEDDDLLRQLTVGMGRYAEAFEGLLVEFRTVKTNASIFSQYLRHQKIEELAHQVHKQMQLSNPSDQVSLKDVEAFVPKQLKEMLAEPLQEQVQKADIEDIVNYAWLSIERPSYEMEETATWVFYLDQQDSPLIRMRSLFDLAKMAAQQQPSTATLTVLGAIYISRHEYRQAIAPLTQARELAGESAGELRDRYTAAVFLALAHQQLGETELAKPYQAEFERHRQELYKTWLKSHTRNFCSLHFLDEQIRRAFVKR